MTKSKDVTSDYLLPAMLKRQLIQIGDINRVAPIDVGIYDEPTRCFKANLEWWSIIAGMVDWLADVAAWQDAEDERYFAILEIQKFMQGVECMSFELRQNPDNSCLLEQSLDGGETWLPVFDYSLCIPPALQTIIEQNTVNNFYDTLNSFTENVYNNYVENYVNSVTDLVPDLGYGDADDNYRDDALCYALTAFIDGVCSARIEYYQSNGDVANDLLGYLALATAIIGAVGLAATGVGTPAAIALAGYAGVLATGLGLGGAFYNVWYGQAQETFKEQYEDLDARKEVVCCLLDALMGANVDQDDFQNAFGCSDLSANAQAIHDAAQILGQEDVTYAALVENMRIGFNSAKLGLLPACLCDDEWMIEYNFTVSNGGFVKSTGANRGIWTDGVGWLGSIKPETSQYGVVVHHALPVSCQIIEAEVSVDFGGGSFEGRIRTNNIPDTGFDGVDFAVYGPTTTHPNCAHGGKGFFVHDDYIQLFFDRVSGSSSGQIQSLRLRGKGEKPSGYTSEGAVFLCP